MTGNAVSALDALAVEYVPYRVLLEHPRTGLPLLDKATGEQAYVDVDGYNSEAGERLKKQALQRAQRGRKGFRDQPADLDAMREENAEALAQLSRGWLLVDLDGNRIDFECNPANARELYARSQTAWISNQVSAALAIEANFIKA